MLEIYVDARRTMNFKLAVVEAVKSGEYETLQDDVRDCFTEDQVEQIEELLDTGDIEELIDEIITEWNGDTLEELLETMETYFAALSASLQFDESSLDMEDEDSLIAGLDDDDEIDDDLDQQEDEMLDSEI